MLWVEFFALTLFHVLVNDALQLFHVIDKYNTHVIVTQYKNVQVHQKNTVSEKTYWEYELALSILSQLANVCKVGQLSILGFSSESIQKIQLRSICSPQF